MSQSCRPIFLWFESLLSNTAAHDIIRHTLHGNTGDLTDDNIITTNLSTRSNNTIHVKLIIWSVLASRSLRMIWDAELFLRSLRIIVGSVKDRSEETSIDGTLVNHDRIFLVVTRVGGDSDDGVATSC